jgi:hypothetical protein
MDRQKFLTALLIMSVLTLLTGLSVTAAPLPPPPYSAYIPVVTNGQATTQPSIDLKSSYAYTTSTNKLHIVGEVQNNTGGIARLIQVNARIKDGGGQVLTQKSSFVFPSALPAGEKSCFDINLDTPAGYASYTLDPATFYTGTTYYTSFTILNHTGTLYPSGNYAITGQIRNDYGVTMNVVGPVGTLYNASGNIIGCKMTTVTGNNLTAGQTSDFNLVFIDRNNSDASSYHLLVASTSAAP